MSLNINVNILSPFIYIWCEDIFFFFLSLSPFFQFPFCWWHRFNIYRLAIDFRHYSRMIHVWNHVSGRVFGKLYFHCRFSHSMAKISSQSNLIFGLEFLLFSFIENSTIQVKNHRSYIISFEQIELFVIEWFHDRKKM